MAKPSKEWLVRTRSLDIHGPFDQRELMEELRKNTFSVDDEICPSGGFWISASHLANRTSDELTATATRSAIFTRSIHSSVSTAEKIVATNSEELTPTPEFVRPPAEPPVLRKPSASQDSTTPAAPARIGAPFLTLIFLAVTVWLVLGQFGGGKTADTASDDTRPVVSAGRTSASPFLKNVYAMIRKGQHREAFVQLTRYHERKPGRKDMEYLVPYSALLITLGESTARAKKFLEQVNNDAASPELKARARKWLGYLALVTQQGDFGEGHFLESLQLNPRDAAARFNLGRAYLFQQKYQQALDYFQLAELEKPDLWLIHVYKGRAKFGLNNLVEARIAFERAVRSSPDRWLTYIYYALFLNHVRETGTARDTVMTMLKRDPHFEQHTPAPWGFYQEPVDYNEYLDAFNKVTGNAAGEEKELGKLYIQYLRDNNSTVIGRRIEAAARKGGLMAKVLALKCVIDRNAPAKAIKAALKRLPVHLAEFGYYAYVLRGEARLRLGDLAGAQSDFKNAQILDERAAVAHWAQAMLLRRLQKGNEAEAAIRQLLSYHPDYIPAVTWEEKL